MSRLWFSFCKASRHRKTVVWKQKNIKSTESGRLPEGSHLGGKRRQGLGEWEKYEGKNKGSQERNGNCWGRCWHPAGAQGGLRRTRRRRGFRDAQPRGGRGGLGRGVGGAGRRGRGCSPGPPASGAPPRRPCRPRCRQRAGSASRPGHLPASPPPSGPAPPRPGRRCGARAVRAAGLRKPTSPSRRKSGRGGDPAAA